MPSEWRFRIARNTQHSLHSPLHCLVVYQNSSDKDILFEFVFFSLRFFHKFCISYVRLLFFYSAGVLYHRLYNSSILERKKHVCNAFSKELSALKSYLRKSSDISCRIFKNKGYSGKNTDRPELQKLLSEIRKDKVRRGEGHIANFCGNRCYVCFYRGYLAVGNSRCTCI